MRSRVPCAMRCAAYRYCELCGFRTERRRRLHAVCFVLRMFFSTVAAVVLWTVHKFCGTIAALPRGISKYSKENSSFVEVYRMIFALSFPILFFKQSPSALFLSNPFQIHPVPSPRKTPVKIYVELNKPHVI